MRQSVEQWRRESRLSIERSRARREGLNRIYAQSPIWVGWAGVLLVAVVIVLVCYGFLIFFGAGAWS